MSDNLPTEKWEIFVKCEGMTNFRGDPIGVDFIGARTRTEVEERFCWLIDKFPQAHGNISHILMEWNGDKRVSLQNIPYFTF